MDVSRAVYSRDLKIAAMRALDAGATGGEIARKYPRPIPAGRASSMVTFWDCPSSRSRCRSLSFAHGTMLRVTIVKKVNPAGYTVLGWKVPNVVTAAKALTAAGVRFERYAGMDQDDLGIWTSTNGDKVAWFKDPDGNTLSISQHE